MRYIDTYNKYRDVRSRYPNFKFTREDIFRLDVAASKLDLKVNKDLSILKMKPDARDFEDLDCHQYGVLLWNEMFDEEFKIESIGDVKRVSNEFVEHMDATKPFGVGFDEIDTIRYITAHSSSSFIGIQNPKLSKFAMNSMIGTINSHMNPVLFDRPWLIDNMKFISDHVKHNAHVMDRSYSDICMSARTSSSSMRSKGSFRDVVLRTSYDDLKNAVLSGSESVDYNIVAGTRSDRRGKFRLICSFHGYFRVIDYMLNNGSYGICEGSGPLAMYTTEGFNNERMWPQLVRMSSRSLESTMVCIDYKGYDTQISMKDYADISMMLNKHRLIGHPDSDIMEWYYDWMIQPKSLIDRSGDNVETIIPYYRTLASGLHGTHSFENIIGISTMLESKKRGVNFRGFWTNGDDQNALIRSKDLEHYIMFLESQFKISWDKSLVNHSLSVWGKLWFSRNFHPAWEIGTFMSIWQKEGGDTSFVEESKLQSNYCKILQVAITLIRLGKSERVVKDWINRLSVVCSIDPNKIPVKLNNLVSVSSNAAIKEIPKGLLSVKKDLLGKTFKLRSLNVNNYYDMLLSMFQNRTFFSLEVKDIEYHNYGKTVYINRSTDYSRMIPHDVPYVFKALYSGKNYSVEEEFVRDVIQSTKSYDGPSSEVYAFNDMYTLAIALNRRNSSSWHKMTQGAL